MSQENGMEVAEGPLDKCLGWLSGHRFYSRNHFLFFKEFFTVSFKSQRWINVFQRKGFLNVFLLYFLDVRFPQDIAYGGSKSEAHLLNNHNNNYDSSPRLAVMLKFSLHKD